ncbi:hypothetical protein D3C86_1846070 [compost metagenome]
MQGQPFALRKVYYVRQYDKANAAEEDQQHGGDIHNRVLNITGKSAEWPVDVTEQIESGVVEDRNAMEHSIIHR